MLAEIPQLSYPVPRGTPYNDLRGGGGAPPEGGGGIFFRHQVYERVEIQLVEVFERLGHLLFRSVKRPKRANKCIL